jgi:hypothetical protein
VNFGHILGCCHRFGIGPNGRPRKSISNRQSQPGFRYLLIDWQHQQYFRQKTVLHLFHHITIRTQQKNLGRTFTAVLRILVWLWETTSSSE